MRLILLLPLLLLVGCAKEEPFQVICGLYSDNSDEHFIIDKKNKMFALKFGDSNWSAYSLQATQDWYGAKGWNNGFRAEQYLNRKSLTTNNGKQCWVSGLSREYPKIVQEFKKSKEKPINKGKNKI